MTSPGIRALLVEDNPTDARLIHELLLENAVPIDVQPATSLAECLDWMGRSELDVVLLDLSLPDSKGLATFSAVQQAAPSCPIVVVSGQDEQRVAIEAVKQGAQDYLVKDRLESDLLYRSLSYAIERARLKESLRSSEERFRQLAESIRDVFWVYDVEQDAMVYLSPAYASISGREEQVPLPLDLYFRDVLRDDRLRVVKAFRLGAHTGEFREEYRIESPARDVRWIWDRGVSLKKNDGRTYRVVGVAEDVTLRKALEAQVLDATTREQHRISRDLHDSVGQELTGLSYMARSLSRKLAETSETNSAIAQAIAEASQSALAQVRMAVRGLAPVELDSHGLMSALEQLATTTQERFDIDCRFSYDHPVLIDDNNLATHLFRIAQEATNNASKHAKADRIELSLEESRNSLELSILDNGVGFEQHQLTAGLGLSTMRYRARAIGASLQIESAPSTGVRVICTLQQYTDPSIIPIEESANVADHDR